MIFTRDEQLHWVLGVLILGYLLCFLALAQFVHPGFALATASVAAAVGVEVYQHVRREGDGNFLDALISSIPGLLAGLVWWGLE